ncbi:MAG: hypothetical protein ABIP48_18515 [Planctomycetota bacterium]
MNATTRLEPLAPGRARELFGMMQEVQRDPSKGLVLDDQGHVTGTVPVDHEQQQHLLGDFDVHA